MPATVGPLQLAFEFEASGVLWAKLAEASVGIQAVGVAMDATAVEEAGGVAKTVEVAGR